ncbi:PAS domain S-box protein [Methylobacterium flocculans]|uniref:PAS domain S-box protein n=1 Tax=Methylobacterium flocculans TaxID=2984843 RepID=UPI0021F26058|nr:PAS domain S-box protein [Methylobacterium sp. FF17]
MPDPARFDPARAMKRQRVLADFGEFALGSEDLDHVLTEACRLVADALGTDRAKILERETPELAIPARESQQLQEQGPSLLVRAGVGWGPGIVGTLRLPGVPGFLGARSPEPLAIRAGRETGVEIPEATIPEAMIPEVMRAAGVVALASVPIRMPGGDIYGLLQVDATEPRDFDREDTEFLRTYAAILGPVIDRLRKASTLRFTEERFRLVVENARDYAIFTTDPADRITDWYAGAQAVYGWTAEEAIGQPAALVFTPEDRAAQVDAREIEAARREGSVPNVRWHLRKDGTRVFIDGTTTTLRAADGTLRGFLKIGQDVTERREAEEARRESEARLTQFGEASSDVLWMRDAVTFQWMYLTLAFETIYGLDRATALAGDNMTSWIALILPEDREGAVASLRRVRAGEHVTFEYRVRRPSDGQIRWVRDTDFPMRDAAGTVRWIGGIGRDISEEKATAEHMSVLVAELQHRTRNLMGLVRATADKTLRNSTDLADFEARYTTRLAALARVQGMLSRLGEGERITFDALIRSEVSALDGDAGKVLLRGPPGVALRSSTLQIFALALHELATNAVKHGAFAQPRGRLEIRWRMETAEPGGEPWLHVDWRERGVRMGAGEGARPSGAGRELIERALPYQLGARTTYAMEADGVHCTIALPVSGHMRTGRTDNA